MLGSADRTKTLASRDWYVQRVECELCQEVQLCTERCQMLTCRECQSSLLPTPGLLTGR
jgi:hypothetical protein